MQCFLFIRVVTPETSFLAQLRVATSEILWIKIRLCRSLLREGEGCVKQRDGTWVVSGWCDWAAETKHRQRPPAALPGTFTLSFRSHLVIINCLFCVISACD